MFANTHGIDGTGAATPPVSLYTNADVTLKDGTFTVTPASGGDSGGSGSGSSDLLSTLGEGSD